ncbi:MAG TPA: cyanophycinase [Gemmatimonadaceae bacterium]|nr:cyanophycinase [Gemmatimonadaceae bacterium]
MMRAASRYVAFAAIALAISAATALAQSAPSTAVVPRGHLVIVGGGPVPESINSRFVALAGGADTARIVILPMASAEPVEAGQAREEIFAALGARATTLILDTATANGDSAIATLRTATGIWFPGGVQSRLTAALLGTRALDVIRERYRAGAVVGGTSAGAAVMSDPMITGDERHPGGARPDSTTGFMTIARDNIITEPGFGLLPGAIVDQHFIRRKRHNRLVSLVLEASPHLGVGIDESTAIVVNPDGVWEVVGESQAIIYDARGAVRTAGAGTPGATGIVMHVLPSGSRFDPRGGSARLPTP